MTIDRKALAEGLRFEERFAARLGARLQPGSGSQPFAKLDVDGGAILWSLKWTSLKNFKLTKVLVDEVVEATEGHNGTGATPGIAIDAPEICSEPLVIMRLSDIEQVLAGEIVIQAVPSARERKRHAAGRSLLDRLDD